MHQRQYPLTVFKDSKKEQKNQLFEREVAVVIQQYGRIIFKDSKSLTPEMKALARVLYSLRIAPAKLDDKLTTKKNYGLRNPYFALARLGQFSVISDLLQRTPPKKDPIWDIVSGSVDGNDRLAASVDFNDTNSIVHWLLQFQLLRRKQLASFADSYIENHKNSYKLRNFKNRATPLLSKANKISQFQFHSQQKISIDQRVDWFVHKEIRGLLFVLIYQHQYPTVLVYMMASYLCQYSSEESSSVFLPLIDKDPEVKLMTQYDENLIKSFGLEAIQWLENKGYQFQKCEDAKENKDPRFTSPGHWDSPLKVEEMARKIVENQQPTESKTFISTLLNYLNSLPVSETSPKTLKAKNGIYQEATNLLNTPNISQQEKQILAESLVNAINVIYDSFNIQAIQKLQKNALQVRGAPKHLHRFCGALMALIGAVVMGLSIAGIPFSGGASLIAGYTIGGVLIAGGIAMFGYYRQKGLSKQLSNLAETEPRPSGSGSFTMDPISSSRAILAKPGH